MKVHEVINESMNFIPVEFIEDKGYWQSVFTPDVTSEIDYDSSDFDQDAMYNDLSYEPPKNKNYNPDLDINLSNQNMHDIMRNTLGFKGDDEGFHIPIDEFIKVASRWYMRNNEPSAAIPSRIETGEMGKRTDSQTGKTSIGRGATIIHGGRREGYEQDVIKRMIASAKEGKKQGATYVSAG